MTNLTPQPGLPVPDAWRGLRRFTPARIALGRSGGSIPTAEWLDFGLAHARARDAVHTPLDIAQLANDLAPLGLPVFTVATAASSRAIYLRRPDLGRVLSNECRATLEDVANRQDASPDVACDLSVIVSDGLSAIAAQRHAAPVLARLIPALQSEGWRLAPLVIAANARVALQDEVGRLFGASLALHLLGERPGLGSPDSLGAYLVHGPAPGRTDADRNCVSNIRPEGLTAEAAADTLFYLLTESRRRGLSGVALKDNRTLPAFP